MIYQLNLSHARRHSEATSCLVLPYCLDGKTFPFSHWCVFACLSGQKRSAAKERKVERRRGKRKGRILGIDLLVYSSSRPLGSSGTRPSWMFPLVDSIFDPFSMHHFLNVDDDGDLCVPVSWPPHHHVSNDTFLRPPSLQYLMPTTLDSLSRADFRPKIPFEVYFVVVKAAMIFIIDLSVSL